MTEKVHDSGLRHYMRLGMLSVKTPQVTPLRPLDEALFFIFKVK